MAKLDFFRCWFKKEAALMPLFTSYSLRSLSVSLSSLFSVIYVYKVLLTLTTRQDLVLAAVFAFFLGTEVFRLLAAFWSKKLSLKFGLRHSLRLGLLFTALFLFIMALVEKQPTLLFIVPPIWGFSSGVYWFGWHGLMAKVCRRDSFGAGLGLIGVINTFLLTGLPFLGGWLIDQFGYPALFLTSIAFVFLGLVSINFIRDERTHQDTSMKEVFNLMGTHKRAALAYAGKAAEDVVYAAAFPLYLFLILKTELSLGEFFTLSKIVVAVFGLGVGWWLDAKGKRGLLAVGSPLVSFTWVGRLLTRAVVPLFVFDVVTHTARKMVSIPLDAWSYEKALDGRATGRAILFRETAIACGSIAAFLLLIIFALCGVGFKAGFIAAAVFSLAPLLSVSRR